jgi:hypothetical protein
MNRPICKTCTDNPVAINYTGKNKTYYRQQCAMCLRRNKKLKPIPPTWFRAGYKKKTKCDKCGFVASNIKTQLRVYYLDGNLKNTNLQNFTTICLNCQASLQDSKISWKPADLVPDF